MAYTGFHVNSTAVAFGWDIYVNGSGSTYYTNEFTDGGGIGSTDWSNDFHGSVPAADNYSTDVNPGSSYAVLWYGDICTAAPGIYDDAYIS